MKRAFMIKKARLNTWALAILLSLSTYNSLDITISISDQTARSGCILNTHSKIYSEKFRTELIFNQHRKRGNVD